MANLEELVVSLVAETSGLRAELSKATSATREATSKMDDAIEEFSKNSSKNVGFFETALATMTGFLAAEAVQQVLSFAKDALGVLTDALGEGYDAALKEETALKRLANSLALSGQYSAEAMKGLQEFTSQMEALTGIEDHAIASNLALLSSLTKLDAEGLQRAQKAALDMSVALGMDLDSATALVAKGIEGNVSMFKRYGIEIQEGSNKAENLANVLNKLEKSFGGAAEGAAQTFGGAVKNLHNAWGNLAEALATSVTKNQTVISALNAITGALHAMTNSSGGLVSILSKGVSIAVITAGVLFEDFLRIIGVVTDAAKVFYLGMQSVVLILNAVADTIRGTINSLSLFGQGVYALVTGNEELAQSIEKAKGSGKGFGEVDWSHTESTFSSMVDTVNSLGTFQSTADKVQAAMENVRFGSEEITASIQNQAVAIEGLSGKQKELYQAFAQGLADEGAALDSRYQYENDLRATNMEIELAQLQEHDANKFAIMEEGLAAQQQAMQAFHEQQWLDLQTAYANKLITDTQYNEAKTALSQKQYLETKKLEADRTKLEQAEQKQREANLSSTLNTIATLSSSSSKELAAIGKAAAVTTATIDGIVAVQKALSSAPPPFNFALAALVGVAAAANVAKIAGVSLNEGGTIAGRGANQDTVPASLTKGETVVTRDLTDKMNDFFSNPESRQGGGQVTVVLQLKDQLVEFIEAKILERQATNVSLLGAGVV